MKNKKTKSNIKCSGVGLFWFSCCLSLLFMVLKAYGIISWSLFWILSPLWIFLGLTALCWLIIIVVCVVLAVAVTAVEKGKDEE